jgi:hypothetical protein
MTSEDNAKDASGRHGAHPRAGSSPSGGGFFEIHVRGQLDSHWYEWLEGLKVKYLDDDEMILSGYIVDQAALLGILNKVNRLNLTLLSVRGVRNDPLHKGPGVQPK